VAELPWLTHDLFADRINEAFAVRADSVAPPSLTLVETTLGDAPGGVGPDGAERRQFSLVFRGPLQPFLPQATYRLEHQELGVLDLFLVPIGPDAEGMRYQAAFA
jgi:uncharacterized protein DUF6916